MFFSCLARRCAAALPFLFAGAPALASDSLNTCVTAWILPAPALVLFLTLPGLAPFYAGLLSSKHDISVLTPLFRTMLRAAVW